MTTPPGAQVGYKGKVSGTTTCRVRIRLIYTTRSGARRHESRDIEPAPSARGAVQKVAHDGAPIPVLERRALRADLGLTCHRGEEAVQLMHERVLPSDDVARGPPAPAVGVVGLGHHDRAKPVHRLAPDEHLQLV